MSLGFPSEQTERIISIDRMQTNVYETGENGAFISIPALLRQKDTASRHGLVLKSLNSITLLTPKIDVELDIPREKISKLPEVFTGVFSFFSGACFLDAAGSENFARSKSIVQSESCGIVRCESCSIVLLLDPKKIMEQQEKFHQGNLQ